jgi:predicted nucleic acid-binding protein
VSLVVLLNSGPLGMITNPRASVENQRCNRWLDELDDRRVRVILPEIADYELRRELVRINKVSGLTRLNALAVTLEYLPLDTATMRRAAQLWADARWRGRPTADPLALDADVILAAQALAIGDPDDEVMVATANIGHLGQFVTAMGWDEITP